MFNVTWIFPKVYSVSFDYSFFWLILILLYKKTRIDKSDILKQREKKYIYAAIYYILKSRLYYILYSAYMSTLHTHLQA